MSKRKAKIVFADLVVAEARSWIGTPFHWQASVKGVGCDCKGLISGVARALGRAEGDSFYAQLADYAKVDPRLLRTGMADLFDAVAWPPQPGDILVMMMAGRAQHLAIMADRDEVIHTYARGPQRVIAMPLLSAVSAWPLDSLWRWREEARP
jgi:NlpC/P60 family putative phage cell wall peptidase